jgi:hypothetical protein
MAIELATFLLGAQCLDQTAPTLAHFSIVIRVFICKYIELATIKTRKNFIQFQ